MERQRQSAETAQRLFSSAVAPYLADIRHPDPDAALTILTRTIAIAAIQRTTGAEAWADVPWERWQAEIADMGFRYLTAERQPG